VKLYSYFRSSAAYRVRIALNLKGLAYDIVPVHLTRGGGDQLTPAYRQLNPQALVPLLQDAGRLLTQSLAIIEYLDEVHPQPPLLPQEPLLDSQATVLEIVQQGAKAAVDLLAEYNQVSVQAREALERGDEELARTLRYDLATEPR